jgi:hypothetical protein
VSNAFQYPKNINFRNATAPLKNFAQGGNFKNSKIHGGKSVSHFLILNNLVFTK